jgi:hypothetical protein
MPLKYGLSKLCTRSRDKEEAFAQRIVCLNSVEDHTTSRKHSPTHGLSKFGRRSRDQEEDYINTVGDRATRRMHSPNTWCI